MNIQQERGGIYLSINQAVSSANIRDSTIANALDQTSSPVQPGGLTKIFNDFIQLQKARNKNMRL